MNAQSTPVLAIDSLRVEYPLANGSVFTAVENASLVIRPGEIHALVGESGAGKTTIGNTVMGLLEKPGRIAAGSIHIDGKRFDAAKGSAAGIVLGRDVGAMFQDPMTSLNPALHDREPAHRSDAVSPQAGQGGGAVARTGIARIRRDP